MRPVLVIAEQVRGHQPLEMPLIQNDHMVQQVASATSHPMLSNTVLPRTAKARSSWLASHLPHSRNHIGTNLGLAVEQQESVRLFVTVELHVQYRRNTARCQFTTVLGVTESLPPPGPARSQLNPKQLVQGSQSIVRSLRVQSQQLPTESQVLKDEVLAGTASADHPAEGMSERRDHSKNLSGKVRIQLFAKSFILQVYDVLARHRCG
jgi:hypothetical protein